MAFALRRVAFFFGRGSLAAVRPSPATSWIRASRCFGSRPVGDRSGTRPKPGARRL